MNAIATAGMWIRPVKPAARLGLKGPAAAQLLGQLGIAIPGPNQFTCEGGADRPGLLRCLRLGYSEFLIEEEGSTARIEAIVAHSPGTRAHPVLRCDFSALIGGTDVYRELAQFCAFDFAILADQPTQVVMTLLAGISVTFTAEPGSAAAPSLRLWCDPGFGTCLAHCLANPGDQR